MRKTIFLLGQKLRNPNMLKEYYKLKETEKSTIEELKLIQLQKLKRLLEDANHTPYYKKVFKNEKINILDINSLDDLKKIPIITKSILIKENDSIQNKKYNKRLMKSETSGSTGESLKFYRNEYWDSVNRAAQLRGYSWYGVKPWEKNGYLWGYDFSFLKKLKTKILDFLVNRFRLFEYNEKKTMNFVKKCKKAKYLEGYSSMIHEVSKIANKNNIDLSNLKMVKGTSEQIFESYQKSANKAFGKKIISEYGAAEAGIIAFECPHGNMHINMENVIVEEINNEILVTNLVSNSFPIIRYKLGDFVMIEEDHNCVCGMKHYVIKEIQGRVGEVIQGNINKYPSLTLYYIFKNLSSKYDLLLNYQAIQCKIGEIELRLSKNITETEKHYLIKEVEKYFNKDLKVDISYKQFIRSKNNKLRTFIQKL
ncbi:MAG: phenylacetate--CoA ligase family protein [Ruminococcaceae bacterium]|nr:phenylacetate--CoA ligase family protein [Oscillospiraceae bacterium]